MQSSGHSNLRTLGELKRIPDFDPSGGSRSVKNEIRRNLLRAIEKGENLFPGVHGYEDTVIPQITMPCSLGTISFFSGCVDSKEPHTPRPNQFTRSGNARRCRVRNQRRSTETYLPRLP